MVVAVVCALSLLVEHAVNAKREVSSNAVAIARISFSQHTNVARLFAKTDGRIREPCLLAAWSLLLPFLSPLAAATSANRRAALHLTFNPCRHSSQLTNRCRFPRTIP